LAARAGHWRCESEAWPGVLFIPSDGDAGRPAEEPDRARRLTTKHLSIGR